MSGAGTRLAHCTFTAAGQLIEGKVVSLTVITCVALLWLPQASVAVQVRVIVKLFAQNPGVTVSLFVITMPLAHWGKLWPVLSAPGVAAVVVFQVNDPQLLPVPVR